MANDINKVLEDKDFVEKILVIKTPEEIQKAFSDKGVKISIEELEEIAKNVSQIINNPNAKEKITDNEMESMSGGANIHKGLRTAAAIIAGVGIGAVGGSAAYLAYKTGKAIDNANEALEGTRTGWVGWFLNMGH